MLIAHYAAGFISKRVDSQPSLGVYLAAAQFLDLLWPFLLFAGIEHARVDPGNTRMTPLDFYDYPFSHGLLAVLGWSVLIALLGYWRYRRQRTAVVLGLTVLSHWILDLIAHRPDLPLLGSEGTRVGLSLWNWPLGAVSLELALFLSGIWLYFRGTRARDKIGKWGGIALITLLSLVWLGSLRGTAPPSIEAVAVAGLLQWLFVALGGWVDRHREAVTRTQ
ncbi:MAG: metal-dependent hydrolase [Oligoflexia bacterium]|nr:metal-dependent hydrolase [Oligoflexia bacterium]